MGLRLEVIKPNDFDLTKLTDVLEDAFDEAADKIKEDFEKTIATWNNKPSVDVQKHGNYERTISITDERYTYVSEGTKPHPITAKPGKMLRFQVPYGPKTQPRQINSSGGSRGGTVVFRKSIPKHPGTKAREFDEAIAEKADRTVPSIIEQFLRRADV